MPVQEVDKNKKATKGLAEEAANWVTTIVNKLNDVKGDLKEDQLLQLQRDLDGILKCATHSSLNCSLLYLSLSSERLIP
jgi:hypothetical protein